MTINELTDLTRSLDVSDQSTRTTIEDLVQVKSILSRKKNVHKICFSGEYSTASLF